MTTKKAVKESVATIANVLLGQIDEENYRKTIDGKSIESLAKSISKVGLLQPIGLMNKKEGGYKLIYGKRRLLAYKNLEKKEIPAMVYPEDDKVFMAMSLTENLQREKTTRKDEITAVVSLKKAGYNADEISELLAMSIKYTMKMLKFVELPKVIKDLYLDGKMNDNQILMLLGLGKKQAKEFLEYHYDEDLNTIIDVDILSDIFDKKDIQSFLKREKGARDLTYIPWNKEMDKISIGASGVMGTCEGCSFNTSYNPLLEGETDNLCTKPECFDTKISMFSAIRIKEYYDIYQFKLRIGDVSNLEGLPKDHPIFGIPTQKALFQTGKFFDIDDLERWEDVELSEEERKKWYEYPGLLMAIAEMAKRRSMSKYNKTMELDEDEQKELDEFIKSIKGKELNSVYFIIDSIQQEPVAEFYIKTNQIDNQDLEESDDNQETKELSQNDEQLEKINNKIERNKVIPYEKISLELKEMYIDTDFINKDDVNSDLLVILSQTIFEQLNFATRDIFWKKANDEKLKVDKHKSVGHFLAQNSQMMNFVMRLFMFTHASGACSPDGDIAQDLLFEYMYNNYPSVKQRVDIVLNKYEEKGKKMEQKRSELLENMEQEVVM